MRLFFALLPDAAASKRLAEVAVVVDRRTSLRLVPFENYHVTLAFIGDIEEVGVPLIRELGRGKLSSRRIA
jgi:2'-5' RNA ligase